MKKRLLSLLILLLFLAGAVQGLTSCQKNDDGEGSDSSSVAPHNHEFNEDWTFDELAHWHICRVEGCSVISERSGHRYDDGGTRCVVCGRIKKASEAMEALGRRTSSTWSLSGIEGDTLVYTERDFLGRVLTRTHYELLAPFSSVPFGTWSKLREEIYTYRDGRLLLSVSYSYAAEDPLLPLRNEAILSYTTQYRYDDTGRLTRADVLNEKGLPTGCYDLYRYDENGKMNAIARYDANLLTQTLTLNEWGEPVRAVDRRGNDFRYTYDSEGNLLSLANGHLTRSLIYEEGLPLTVTVKNTKTAKTLSLSFDLNKQSLVTRSATKTDSLELSSLFTYDTANRLTKVVCTDIKTKKTVLTLTRDYREDGKLLRHTVTEEPDAETLLSTQTSYTYGEDGSLTRIHRDLTQNGSPLGEQSLSMTYENGRLKQKKLGTETVDYAYGEKGILTRQTVTGTDGVITIDFDEIGNPTSLTVDTVGEPLLLCTFATVNHDYRFLREFAEDTRPTEYHASRIESDGQTVERKFDGRLRAIKETVTSADGTSVSVTAYSYDAQDRLRTEDRAVTLFDEAETPLGTKRTVIEYRTDETKIRESQYDENGELRLVLEYKIGESGSYLYRMTEYGEDGEMTVTLYDENGDPIPSANS